MQNKTKSEQHQDKTHQNPDKFLSIFLFWCIKHYFIQKIMQSFETKNQVQNTEALKSLRL